LTIFATGVRAFECARNSLTSAFVYSRRTDFFVLAVFFAFFVTYYFLDVVKALTITNTLSRKLY
jgi:hypothetical protein